MKQLITAIILTISLITSFSNAEADTMTPAKLTALAANIRANTNPTVVAARAPDIRNDTLIAEWYNSPSTIDAWNDNMDDRSIFEATDVTKYDGISAGKRDAQARIERYAPIDFRRTAMRKALQDIWGNADSIPVLQACVRKALNCEIALNDSTTATTNTVTALKLSWTGTVSVTDVSEALNRY